VVSAADPLRSLILISLTDSNLKEQEAIGSLRLATRISTNRRKLETTNCKNHCRTLTDSILKEQEQMALNYITHTPLLLTSTCTNGYTFAPAYCCCSQLEGTEINWHQPANCGSLNEIKQDSFCSEDRHVLYFQT
jgi:hypothetical protein